MENKQVVIIGAGVAGLVAAIHCEKAGLKPILIEAGSEIGGRTQSEMNGSFVLDKGFQVLLTEYEMVKKYLDLKALNLKYFDSGAFVFTKEKKYELTDPLRKWNKIFSMLFSNIGTFYDKWLILKLSLSLKNQKDADIFNENEETTHTFLTNYGFSERIIRLFFKPFFSGIFLEDHLNTPASMFKFVFGKFSKGFAAIPMDGIQEIPKQLFSKLKNTELRLNTVVEKVMDQDLIFKNGEQLHFDKLIMATDSQNIHLNSKQEEHIKYNQTVQYYFKTDVNLLGKKIGLIADEKSPLLGIAAISELKGNIKEGNLLSVTLKAECKSEEISIEKIEQEIRIFLKAPNLTLTFLEVNKISMALPICKKLYFSRPLSDFKLGKNKYIAGDYLLNPSLDAAMRSGQLASEAMLSEIN